MRLPHAVVPRVRAQPLLRQAALGGRQLHLVRLGDKRGSPQPADGGADGPDGRVADGVRQRRGELAHGDGERAGGVRTSGQSTRLGAPLCVH